MQHHMRAKLEGQEIIDGTLEISMKERYLGQDAKHYDDESMEGRPNERGTIAEVSDENKTPPP